MVRIVRSSERGVTDTGWLKSLHTFAFAEHQEAVLRDFGLLKVLNEDRLRPGQGFPAHLRKDLEILTYVLDGTLEHRDSTGHASLIRAGEVYRMSAGTGVRDTTFNSSRSRWVHYLQLWLTTGEPGSPPGYEQKRFSDEEKRNRWCLLASRHSDEGSVAVYQDARVWTSILEAGHKLEATLAAGRSAWLQVIRGHLTLNGWLLGDGDGAAITEESVLHFLGESEAEFLLVDLA